MMKFLYFETKKAINDYLPIIIETFSPVINIVKHTINDNSLVVLYDYNELEIEKLANNLASELYDFKVYESIWYDDLKLLEEDIKYIRAVFKNIMRSDIYINCKIVLSEMINNKDYSLSKFVLKEFVDDIEMKKTIITFLEANQNASLAAKELYLHRNTLNQRLDKFQLKTSFNVKNFIEGYLIYRLIK